MLSNVHEFVKVDPVWIVGEQHVDELVDVALVFVALVHDFDPRHVVCVGLTRLVDGVGNAVPFFDNDGYALQD